MRSALLFLSLVVNASCASVHQAGRKEGTVVPQITERSSMRETGVPITFVEAGEADPLDFKEYWDPFMARVDDVGRLSVIPAAFAIDHLPEQAEESKGTMSRPGIEQYHDPGEPAHKVTPGRIH